MTRYTIHYRCDIQDCRIALVVADGRGGRTIVAMNAGGTYSSRRRSR
jgi:hypothetical protein